MTEDMYVFDTLFVRFCDSFRFASHFFINKNAELIARHFPKSILVFTYPV